MVLSTTEQVARSTIFLKIFLEVWFLSTEQVARSTCFEKSRLLLDLMVDARFKPTIKYDLYDGVDHGDGVNHGDGVDHDGGVDHGCDNVAHKVDDVQGSSCSS